MTPTPTATPTATPVPPTPTPTIAPLPTPTPVVAAQYAPVGGSLSEGEMRALLAAAGFPEWTWPRALAIAWCESRWNPNATGSQGERGLFQVHPWYHGDATYDPLGNVVAAYRISEGGTNWWAWTCAR